MTLRCLAAVALVVSLPTSAPLLAGPRDEVISEAAVRSLGLTRSWVTRADMDASRSRLTALSLFGGALFVQSDRAMINGFNAENGKPLWESGRQIGNPSHPSFTPGFNENLLGVVNGARLFLLNRFTGDVLWDKQLPGSPVDGPSFSDQRVYVPLAGGLIICHRFKPAGDPAKDLKVRKPDDAEPPATEESRVLARESFKLSQDYIAPMLIQALGTSSFRPIVMRQSDDDEMIAWPTRNKVLVCRIDRMQRNVFALKYRVEMNAEIQAPLVYLPYRSSSADFGWIGAVSASGMVAMIDEKSGDTVWQFSANEPVTQPLAMAGESLFVVTQLGEMFCLDVATGKARWAASRVAQFLATSKDRVFASDRAGGHVRVFDAATGRPLGSVAAPSMTVRLSNTLSDRVYLASPTGLVQSLREEQLVKPLDYTPERKKVEKPGRKPKPGAEGDDAADAEPAKPAKKAAKKGKDADEEQ